MTASTSDATDSSDWGDTHPTRWRMLALVSSAELLGMSLWFAANAVSGPLASRWEVADSASGAWLMSAVQLGFVTGTATAAILNLADVIPARRYFATSAVLGAITNSTVLLASSFHTGLATRFFTGFFLAGVYPPAMKMAATWFRQRRGLAIGTVVGALTVGKATPYLILATTGALVGGAIPANHVAPVVLAASLGALIAAGLVLKVYHDGPYPFQPRPFSWRLAADILKQRRWRLATAGYLGHMWELYAFWTWIPAFITASLATMSEGQDPSPTTTAMWSFTAIAVGGAGCIWGGLSADRTGRERLVVISMAASGSCALLTPIVFGRSSLILVALLCVWGFFVIADSAQFSALVTDAVPTYAVGTALTLQTSLGFLLTTFSIHLIAPLVALTGWQWAFPILALGPTLGIIAIRRLHILHASARTRASLGHA